MADYEEVDGFVFRKLNSKSSSSTTSSRSSKRQKTSLPAFKVPKLSSRISAEVYKEKPAARAQKLVEFFLEKQLASFKKVNKIGNLSSVVDDISRRFMAELGQTTIDALNRRRSLISRQGAALTKPNPSNEMRKKRIAVLEALKTSYSNELAVWKDLESELSSFDSSDDPAPRPDMYRALTDRDVSSSLTTSRKAMDSTVLRTDSLKKKLREARRKSAECLEAAQGTSEAFHSYALTVMGSGSESSAMDASSLLREIVYSDKVLEAIEEPVEVSAAETPQQESKAKGGEEGGPGSSGSKEGNPPTAPRPTARRRSTRASLGSTGSRRRSSISEEPTPPVMRKILRGHV